MAQNNIGDWGDWYAYEFAPVWNNHEQQWDAPDGHQERLFQGPIKKTISPDITKNITLQITGKLGQREACGIRHKRALRTFVQVNLPCYA